jgi:hypothetical protein
MLLLCQIRSPNIEIPAFAPQSGASRRQAEKIQNPNDKILNFLVSICILNSALTRLVSNLGLRI